ncbi:MAG: UDP-N-acetylglucosamine 2-epimerase (non-hydrolyzing) [Rectinemataceae bacterium]|nr:UDP-N-acetylglucosamine 2-epimerase (non-hydrolyzing) [Rectinemataceae bacterium]
MKEILTVVGARPQFVKAAVLSRYLNANGARLGLREYLVHTGQHYDDNMSEVFFREMGIPAPDINLAVGSGSHGKMTGEMLALLEAIMLERKPDIVLVYGDTNSTLAGALAASKLQIPVAHVEAGLRSFMMAMPEEQNRRLTDQLSTWLFCPTTTAVANLDREGIRDLAGPGAPTADRKRVANVGDIMYEASLYYRQAVSAPESVAARFSVQDPFFLLTIHRAENTDDPVRLRRIADAIEALSDRTILFPVHPRTRKIMASSGIHLGEHVRQIDPVGYLDMIALEATCELVLTDSGGVQKEAFFFDKPCVTLRDATEWVELVDSGWNTLVGADTDKIVQAVRAAKIPLEKPALYGDGACAEKVARELAQGVQ